MVSRNLKNSRSQIKDFKHVNFPNQKESRKIEQWQFFQNKLIFFYLCNVVNTSLIFWVKSIRNLRKTPEYRPCIKLWTFEIFYFGITKIILLWAYSQYPIIFFKFRRARQETRRYRFWRETVLCKNKNRGSIRKGRFTNIIWFLRYFMSEISTLQ